MVNALNALSSAGLLMSGQARPVASRSPLASLTALAAGVVPRDAPATGTAAAPSIYSVNHVDANKLKINLMERVGKAFGLNFEDFKDSTELARAIRPLFQEMSPAAVRAMETSLGLDKLGVSLRSVLEAMEMPGGEADDRLDGALRAAAGEMSATGGTGTSADGLDEIGLYAPTSAHR